ncbi:hypothetical protein T484DRAFT_1799996, partial [Baffinella frigidus]
ATRLRFIAERVPALQQDALRMLLQEAPRRRGAICPEVKSGQNVQLYKDVLEVVGGKLGPAESVCDQYGPIMLGKDVLEVVGGKLGPAESVCDQAWVDKVQEQSDKALEKLEAWVDKVQEQSDKALEKLEVDLCQHKLNSIKEKALEKLEVDLCQHKLNFIKEKLEVDLCQHKLNSIKEKVRMGHNDLGHHFHLVGNLNEALKCFVRTRDYDLSP